MPELPEVEVVRLFLSDHLVGKTIINLQILTPKSFLGQPDSILHQPLTHITRLGKQLSLHLKSGQILLVHLKMTGQLVYQNKVMGHPTKNSLSLPNKSTRLIFTLSDTSLLYFNDQRKFGWIKVVCDQSVLSLLQHHLGVDIFSPDFTPKYLYSQLQKSARPIKLVLLDQTKFAGIGNIYACDSLFLAKIHPLTPANSLNKNQCTNLCHSLIQIMKQSVLVGGSTAKDNTYLRPDGTKGENQFNFRVYQRVGQPCLICRTPIKRLTLGGRGTFFCPKCQPLSH